MLFKVTASPLKHKKQSDGSTSSKPISQETTGKFWTNLQLARACPGSVVYPVVSWAVRQSCPCFIQRDDSHSWLLLSMPSLPGECSQETGVLLHLWFYRIPIPSSQVCSLLESELLETFLLIFIAPENTMMLKRQYIFRK